MRIGIDLGGTKIEGIVLDDEGTERARQRIDSPQGDYGATILSIKQLTESIAAKADCPVDTPVGIGIPGAISPRTRLVKNANSTWLIGHALDRDLAEALQRNVKLANDANCFAVSEAVDGAGKGHGMVFGVILGTGVGGGIAIDGQVHAGLNAIAGEWGHNPLPWPRDSLGVSELPGPTCYCGKNGCIETFLSGPGFTRDFIAAGGPDLTATEIAVRAHTGDATAQEAIERYMDRLARAIAGVVNILDPDAIVLGGGLSRLGTIYDRLPGILSQYVFSDVCETPILKNRHGDSSGVRGAAWLWPIKK
ncbi:MAG: ROK family protein [Rhodospirillales bacterium]